MRCSATYVMKRIPWDPSTRIYVSIDMYVGIYLSGVRPPIRPTGPAVSKTGEWEIFVGNILEL